MHPTMLESILLQRTSSIVDKWFDAVLDTYPPDAKRFLKKQKDRFANPVGTTLRKEMENLYQELLQGPDRDNASAILDRIIRIRAVQDFPPSQAVGFVFSLKGIIHSEMEIETAEEDLGPELSALDTRIDGLGLLAFDVYMRCKDKVFEIRVKEARTHVSKLLQRAGLVCESPEPAKDPDQDENGTIP